MKDTEVKPTRHFDVIILGGGIAGMTAAIFSARANLKTVLLEEKVCGGLANWTQTVENFPSHRSINGMELMELVEAQVEDLGVEVDQAVEVERMDFSRSLKTVETGEAIYTGKAIILATGRQPISLNLDTDCENIHYCSVCDGSSYKGKKVLVVGAGNSGFDESFYLLSLGVSEIILVEALDQCCASEVSQMKLQKFDNVKVQTSTLVEAITNEGNACLVRLKSRLDQKTEKIYVDGVFVFIGQKPNTSIFQDLVELDSNGYIVVGQD